MSPSDGLAIVGWFAAAALGALGSYFVTAAHAARKGRFDRAFLLSDQYNSHEMLELRRFADRVAARSKGQPLGMMVSSAQASDEERFAFSAIVHFFRRLAVSYETGAVDRKLTRRLFGPALRYWMPRLLRRPSATENGREWRTTLRELRQLYRHAVLLPRKRLIRRKSLSNGVRKRLPFFRASRQIPG